MIDEFFVCIADKLGKCDAQLNELNLIFTLGSATISASSLPCGIFLDTYGKGVPFENVIETQVLS